MIDEETLAQINGKYADSSDPWRLCHDEHEFAMDLWLIEAMLEMTPDQRLENHQRMLNLVLQIEEVGERGFTDDKAD